MIMDLPSSKEMTDRNRRQGTVLAWCQAAFGYDKAEYAPTVRLMRFIEEAAELAQARNLPYEEVIKIVEYVYSREPGKDVQEVGGVMVTLQSFCEAADISLAAAEWQEINRCNGKPIEEFRKRQKEKKDAGL